MAREYDAADVAALDARMHKVIRASARRHGTWEVIEDHTPLDELLSREAADVEGSEEMRLRQEVFHKLLGWVFGQGPHPAAVLRRIFMLAYQLDSGLIAHVTMADLGLLLGNTKAAWSWRIARVFDGTLRSRSQKRAGAKENYSKAAMGNNSRRKGERRKRRQQDGN